MASLLRIAIIALLFYLVVWVVRGLVRPAPGRMPGAPQGEKELVADSQTGVYFDKRKALTVLRDGKTYYFSTAETRDAWLRQNSN
ncbi:MAG: hypothetical protein LBQ12_01450 [Deltaproteobacteria bacterium]|jgi:hypothetical protein|nr:hypothetical protein [Deltaproteobacteria bacterium]